MQESAFNREFLEISGKISEDFGEKLKVSAPDRKNEAQKQEEEENEEDFSFACANPDGSPISADTIFQDGQIRPIFPIFDQSLLYDNVNDDGEPSNLSASSSFRHPLRKLFVEEQSKHEEEPAGPYCAWNLGKTVKEVSPETCKKSNSTGFSKLWRFRELVLRSNSDGKDAFVFLNNNNDNNSEIICHSKTTTTEKTTTEKTSKSEKAEKVKMTVEKKVKAQTVSSAYEKHYVKNREMRKGEKRKTNSPYRQELLGIFTNVNGLSRNVHPF
ncbi:hypothetical protein ACOSP7_018333 [Xanthoceras sorbifolium]|uniref:Uncharacterized protein n=1 Tax=Xanthoceras sorbifolium TaxID=99658 RepID=A0ABQ8I1D2_9ROSI|nr:hypothetical protein JRO89_XS05G0081500 [Xanthoceras sorbifolium]